MQFDLVCVSALCLCCVFIISMFRILECLTVQDAVAIIFACSVFGNGVIHQQQQHIVLLSCAGVREHCTTIHVGC